MEYNFSNIEQKWKKIWNENNIYKTPTISDKPKCYVLDMFPYPSGAGLHVGHPLGYIGSDIYARYKRLKGFNVLHPMGFDSFGLPAEQYALETGQHPKNTTVKNIDVFKKQLDKIGFSFDWDREVWTSNKSYYKWTQWIFLQLFNSYSDRKLNKADKIENLISIFKLEGNKNNICPGDSKINFNANEWDAFTESEQQNILMNYRLAFSAVGEVNWCEALGTVLANDEVVNGVSERGGHIVEKKKLRQWYLRITEYAQRLIDGLDTIQFSDAMKEMQLNWIGKSSGAELDFEIKKNTSILKAYTTRPDTIFGVDFMVVAPEHELIKKITTPEQLGAVNEYISYVKSRSERERMAEKKITGCFTGAYCLNPFNGAEIPIWISEYVLAGYGTGAIMAVPCGDERDYKFAKHFGLNITNIIGSYFDGENANNTKEAKLENSGFLNGIVMKEAIEIAITTMEKKGIGLRKTNYRMRDAAFSRQRYWGEPFPIYWKNGIAYAMNENELPLELPVVDKYGPGPDGEGPLANIDEWINYSENAKRESSTMPGFAGSSWYFLRYMDPTNDTNFCDRKLSDYWNQVDLYVGGTEHAVGHLLYSRLWTKVLYDLGHIGFDEPFKKLLNQGMIQGSSRFVHRINGTNKFVSAGLKNNYETTPLHVDVSIVDGFELDTEAFKKWKPEFENASFELENEKFICIAEVEKMSKSKYNTVNPDDIVAKYGADTFRLYEMFLGPIEISKPWDTKGIEGVSRFLRKLWRLFFDDVKLVLVWTNETLTEAEEKIIHKTIKKIEEDTERFSYNTAVSAFMVTVNELTEINCRKKIALEKLLILMAPYAPFIAEELFECLGNKESILNAPFPIYDQKYLIENEKEYPISINGKLRTTLNLSLALEQADIEKLILENEIVQKWLDGKPAKKMIYVKGKMINIVV